MLHSAVATLGPQKKIVVTKILATINLKILATINLKILVTIIHFFISILVPHIERTHDTPHLDDTPDTQGTTHRTHTQDTTHRTHKDEVQLQR